MKLEYIIRKTVILFLSLFALTGLMAPEMINAAERNIPIYHNNIYYYDDEEDSTSNPDNLFIQGDYGKLQMIFSSPDIETQIIRKEFISGNPQILQVDSEGNYRCTGIGKTSVQIYGYDSAGALIFSVSHFFVIYSDVSAMSLSSTNLVIYQVPEVYLSETNNSGNTKEIALINAPDLTTHSFSYTSSNPSLSVTCTLNPERKSLLINTDNSYWNPSSGTTLLTIIINGKTFTFDVTIKKVTINKASAVLAKGKKTTLKVKGYPGTISWHTTNKKVATVNKKGIVRSKKTGNSVIYASIDGKKIGCAVSVVTSKMKKVITTATKMGSKWKYSQAKRMQNGYYDCSSLVWRSYKKAGKTFGNKNYAPVAADIAKYCASHKKMIKGGLSYRNIKKMKLRPGDIIFETGSSNSRYKGIYHVEMFTGYQCEGFSGNTPVIGTRWAARPANYYMDCIMARP